MYFFGSFRSYIVGSLEILHRLIHDEGVDLKFKFNSLFGLKVIFDLGDVFLINLIEVYFLHKLLEIASF